MNEAQGRVHKAEEAGSRAVRLADKLTNEERPLEFLARFVAFRQVRLKPKCPVKPIELNSKVLELDADTSQNLFNRTMV